MRVDFVYEQARPHIAFEVTRIVDDNVQELSSFILKMGESLTEFAQEHRLGFWSIALREGRKAKTLRSAIAEFFTAASSHDPPVVFAAETMKVDAMPLPEELVQLGMVCAMKHLGESGVHMWPQVTGSPAGIWGFSDQLTARVVDKDPVLREARPRETHLAVVVEDLRFVADPSLSAPPKLTEDIDVLWLFLSDFLEPRDVDRVWRARRGMTSWELLWPRLW